MNSDEEMEVIARYRHERIVQALSEPGTMLAYQVEKEKRLQEAKGDADQLRPSEWIDQLTSRVRDVQVAYSTMDPYQYDARLVDLAASVWLCLEAHRRQFPEIGTGGVR